MKGTGKPLVKEGYVGKAKGLTQLLKERGLFVEGMTKDGTCTAGGRKFYKGDEFNMVLVLNNQPDYKAERTALETLGDSLGVVVQASTKCHPEIAGEGIEYGFALMKMHYKKHNNFCARTLQARIRDAIKSTLTVDAARLCARRAAEYLQCIYRARSGHA